MSLKDVFKFLILRPQQNKSKKLHTGIYLLRFFRQMGKSHQTEIFQGLFNTAKSVRFKIDFVFCKIDVGRHHCPKWGLKKELKMAFSFILLPEGGIHPINGILLRIRVWQLRVLSLDREALHWRTKKHSLKKDKQADTQNTEREIQTK